MAWGNVVKCAWSDKFRMPSIDELRAGLAKQGQSVFDDARRRLNELDGVTETLVWEGVPWRWTLVYTGPSGTEPRVIAYLIPDPQRIQLCVPLSQDHVDRLPLKRMKKSLRDGIVFARNVAGMWWPTWDVPSKTAVEEVLDLVSRRHAMSAEAAPASAHA
jgi:hypothetical protein